MERADFFMHTRADRLEGLHAHAKRWSHLPGLKDLARRIGAADPATCTPNEEVGFMGEIFDALIAAGEPDGIAWMKWQPIRAELSRAATAHDPTQPWAHYYSSEHSEIFLENLNSCLGLLRKEMPSNQRLHVLLSALTQIHGLLDNYLWKQVFAPIRSLPKPHDKAGMAVKEFLDLHWADKLPAPLSDLRDGWTHGTAQLLPTGLVVLDRQTREVKARLGLAALERYVILGRATWTAIQWDFTFGAAIEEREGRKIRLEPLPERLQPRRKEK